MILPLCQQSKKMKENIIKGIMTDILETKDRKSAFDVFLEGPMGAFPFWTWVGLLFITDAQT